MWFLHHAVHKWSGAQNAKLQITASGRASYSVTPYSMLRTQQLKIHISQDSVGSQELNIFAIIIESWHSNILECQCGQNSVKKNQEHSIWHALLVLCSFYYRGLKFVDYSAPVTLV